MLANVFAFLCMAVQIKETVTQMKCYRLRQKNKRGMFTFTEHDPMAHHDEEIESTEASLIYNLYRNKKFVVGVVDIFL